MTLYLWLKQDGEGCGYGIGCGERLDELKATSLADAHDEIKGRMNDCSLGSKERRDGAKAMVLECKADVGSILQEVIDETDEEEARSELERQAALVKVATEKLERLKAKARKA